MSTTPKLFEDGVFCTDTSKFIDYPVIKIRNYDKTESKAFKRIIFLISLCSLLSGLAVLFY
jgi:hypothetical protein